MQYPKECRIEKACSTNKCRPSLHNAMLTERAEGEPVLVATDGHIMAVVPVTFDDGDTAGAVPAAVLKRSGGRVKVNSACELSTGESIPRPETDGLPNWKQIYDDEQERPRVVTLGINPTLLKNLADALGSKIVKLEITSGTDAIKVTGKNGDGLIMPCRY